MAREGTRSATGHSRPRVFTTVDTAPAIQRTKTAKPKTPTQTTAKETVAKKPGRPAGVTKTKAPVKKAAATATKAKATAKKATAKAKDETKKAPTTAAK